MTIHFFHRKPMPNHHSIENVFHTIETILQHQGHHTRRIESPYFSQGLKQRWAIARHARQHQGPINHVVGDIHFAVIPLKKAHTVLTIHDIGHLQKSTGWRYWFLWLLWLLMPSWRCRYLTVISTNTKHDILKESYGLIPARKIKVIHDPVTEGFHRSPKPFNEEQPHILQVGTGEHKNVERLIEALQGLNCKLLLLGTLRPELQNKLETYRIDYEHYEGLSNAEVFALYQKADILTLISLTEGFGLPIIEAQMTGRPVITANNTSMPEVAGEAALLVDARSVEQIRQALQRLLDEPQLRQQLIAQGRENVKRFSPERIAEHYLALYRSLQ